MSLKDLAHSLDTPDTEDIRDVLSMLGVGRNQDGSTTLDGEQMGRLCSYLVHAGLVVGRNQVVDSVRSGLPKPADVIADKTTTAAMYNELSRTLRAYDAESERIAALVIKSVVPQQHDPIHNKDILEEVLEQLKPSMPALHHAWFGEPESRPSMLAMLRVSGMNAAWMAASKHTPEDLARVRSVIEPEIAQAVVVQAPAYLGAAPGVVDDRYWSHKYGWSPLEDADVYLPCDRNGMVHSVDLLRFHKNTKFVSLSEAMQPGQQQEQPEESDIAPEADPKGGRGEGDGAGAPVIEPSYAPS